MVIIGSDANKKRSFCEELSTQKSHLEIPSEKKIDKVSITNIRVNNSITRATVCACEPLDSPKLTKINFLEN